ncbi:ABC transporter ATP-binding protein [Clostridium brassicae]|uniref:ABC transporter ATP-binding protein n=1 Tax=Clostridium brassicae TaxID=2999072 RepID=A0ABT4DEH1_9CLOT|nr:ABC transporter ATP-binding protein [Clostridium brassicae]MCY6960048.1 ABC transporter ATP-binding protein [Clostridium brassicae]
MDLLNVENISFSYESRQILKDISFSVEEGNICGILGQNGTGKTTLLKCIHGLLKPKHGNVLIKGKSVHSMNCKERARNISTVPQNINIIFSYTVLDVVLMAKVSKVNLFTSPSKEDEKEVIKILNSLEIGHLSDKRFNELSGGEKQMVLIARAMYQDTPIILLDEPTAHLDYKNQIMIMDTIKDIVNKKNLTAIINIHDPNLALNYCDNIIMIKSGRVLIKGKTSDIICENYLSNLYDMPVLVDKTQNGRSVVVPFSA